MKTLQTAAIAAVMVAGTSAFAQNAPAKIHGHVQNAAGMPIKGVKVLLVKGRPSGELKDVKWDYTIPVDDNGDFKADNIAPGEYFADAFTDGKNIDFVESVKIVSGEDHLLNIDMTRKEYLDKMSPEDKAALEEFKKRNASASAANAKIANLNALLATTREHLKTAAATKADVSADVTAMKGAVDAKPDESILWMEYGNTLQSQGDHLAAEDRKASKSAMSDEEVIKNYTDAAAAFQKAVDTNAASKKPDPAAQGAAYNQMGNAQAKLGHAKEASDAFESAVKVDPTKAGMYYNNEAAVMFNASQTDAAAAAAEKAIAADPTRPDPYFIKGQALISKATFDAKTQKLVAPPGCVDAYQKYISLAPPESKNVQTAKDVLTGLGETINTKYVAPKGKK